MIVYEAKTRSYIINGKNYSYIIYVNDAGYLQQLYYGAKLTSADAEYLVRSFGKNATENDMNADMFTDSMALELGSFGKGDFRSATVIAEREDGALMSRFKYVKHTIFGGVAHIKGQPCVRKADQTLTVTLKDDFSETEIYLNYTASDKNNWEATYFDFDNEKLCAIIDEAARLGIDTFVLDDGWFGERNDDKSGLGDWFVNGKKLVGGLKAVIERCKKNGLKFGLWFEPEMISEDSELYRAHPEWAICKTGVKPSRGRNQLVLDFTKKEVVDYVFEAVSRVLKENDISYVKWDKNRDITEFYTDGLPADRQGEFAHRYTLGFYDLAERLNSAFPNVFFEGCAGGGGRFDGGALYYFPQIWTSDDTDGLERTKIQWGTSICYPVSTMSCHVSACPNHQTQRITPFETRGAIASLGATGYELDLTKLTEQEKNQVKKQIQNYKLIDELVLNGDLYRLSDPFTSNYFCEMIVSKDKTKAYVVGERFRGEPCDFDRVLKLDGLDKNKTYEISELNVTASGKALMSAGVMYPRLPDCGSWTWHIEEKK